MTVPPSDEITGYWVLGTVVGDSTGPCSQLRTDDGRTITVSGDPAGTLTAGQHIRARLLSPARPVYCGTDEALLLLETKPAA